MKNVHKIWLTSDFHFGHKNIIDYCKRPYKNISEMNSDLIKKYNSCVGKNDICYILGDVSFLNSKSTKQIIKSLNGFKFLIKGNHDRKSNQYYRELGFCEVYDKPIIIKVNNQDIILSHEPIKNSTLINIHGHLHNNLLIDKYLEKPNNYYCVSIENCEYKPILLNKILSEYFAQEIEFDW